MEYDFYKGDWVLSCAMPYPQYVKIKEEHTDIEIVADIRDEASDRITTAIIDWEELEPISIEPEVLEAFGFKLEYIADMCFAKLKFDDGTGVYLSKKGRDWDFSNNEPFEFPPFIYATVCCPVKNIHDIQHAMRVAGITKELEYKEK